MSRLVSLPAAADAAPLPADLLHGFALRPDSGDWDGLHYRGAMLAEANLAEVRAMAGVVAAVQRDNFLGVVAATSIHARQAAAHLRPIWREAEVKRAWPGSGASDAGVGRFVWRLPSTETPVGAQAVAWCLNGQARLWLPSSTPDVQRMVLREVAALLRLPEAALSLACLPGAAPLHPLEAMDAAADAALLSQAVGRPVGVACHSSALARCGELVLHAAQPAAQSGTALQPRGAAAQATLISDAPWAVRPSMARLLSQPGLARAAAPASVCSAGTVQVRMQAGGLSQAGIDDLNAAQVFASESLWHEQAIAQGRDPLDWRLRHLPEGRGRELARAVAEGAAWADEQNGQTEDGRLRGRGFATAQLQTLDADGAEHMAWSAWVAEVAVHPRTGEIEVTRVVAGHDSQNLQAAKAASQRPEIVRQDPQLLADARRLLGTSAAFDNWASPVAEAASALPAHRDGSMGLEPSGSHGLVRQGQLGLDGVVTLPAAAAIANAIRHATDVRLREVPFQPEQLRLALAGKGGQPARSPLRRGWGWLAAAAAGIAGTASLAWPLKPALPLMDEPGGPDASLYSPQALERGRLIAAAGDCVVCHTAAGGAPNAGGLGLETPFGTIYSTNITPDPETGIGRWSYAAFERAMRHGIHQDGRQLYPAFPYTAFAKLSEGDLQALYGYLMSQPAVKAKAPETRLAFPYSLRSAMAGWNLLFHDATPFKSDPGRSPEWNRGAYLVEGAGHCAACHSPRNALGAEKGGIHYLGGGEAEGWSAPALNALAGGKLPWSRGELYQYLRSGFSARHGVAAGPMAPVIHGLAELPESDVRAIATYLMELPGRPRDQEASAPVSAKPAAAPATATAATPVFGGHVNGERIYQSACAVCHEAGSGPTLFGVKPLLGLNTNLHAADPDNLIQVILNGIQSPANDALGYMPGFRDSLDDRQIADLLGYLRERFAPEEKAWPDDTTTISRLRMQAHGTHGP
jgi:nicotinate dehydrogenase subunit B